MDAYAILSNMNLELVDNIASEEWEEALSSLSDGGELLQSVFWQRLAEVEHKTCYRWAWRLDGQLVALAQVLETKRAGLKFWYIPRGPVCLSAQSAVTVRPRLLADLRWLATKHGVVALHFEPQGWPSSPEVWGVITKAIQPPQSLFLDLSMGTEALLASMHPKTRYNLRLAEKRGVMVVRGTEDDLPVFMSLMKATTTRDGFRGHSLEHYRQLLLQGSPVVELYLAKREDKVLAAGIFAFYQGRAVYLHGASADADRQYMAPYLLQWRMIQLAIESACRYYDFYGIDEQKWPGVTRFKRGFGGEERLYPGTFLMLIRPLTYYFYRCGASCLNYLRFKFA